MLRRFQLFFVIFQLIVRVVDKERSGETVTSLSKLFFSKQAELKKILSKGNGCSVSISCKLLRGLTAPDAFWR